MGKLKALLKAQWFDALMLIVSCACFALFGWRAREMTRVGAGASARIAVFEEGSGEKKRAGSLDFVNAIPGTEFYNMDAVWVGRGKSATLQIDEGDKLILSEKTLLILKRPVRPRKGGKNSDQFKLVAGKLKIVRGTGITEERKSENEQNSEIPKKRDPATLDPEDRSGLTTHPKHRTLLLVRQRPGGEELKSEIAFSWPNLFSGFVALKNTITGTVHYEKVTRSQGIKLVVEVGSQYIWQLVTPDKAVALGPFEFEVRAVDAQSTAEILKRKEMDQPIEFLW